MYQIKRSRMGHTDAEWLGPYRGRATKKKKGMRRANREQSRLPPP